MRAKTQERNNALWDDFGNHGGWYSQFYDERYRFLAKKYNLSIITVRGIIYKSLQLDSLMRAIGQ